MDQEEIKKCAEQMKSIADLVDLLNHINHTGESFTKKRITKKQLLYFCNPKKSKNRYTIFHIHKKSGGTREICAPCKQLKVILFLLNELFQAIYKPNSSAMGFVQGRSIVDNATVHIGHHYVFNIDLSNFFPSIPQARVWKRLQLPPFNFNVQIANVVAGLCCAPNENNMNVLPQGAPTSPVLSNAICEKLDRKMRGLAKHFGLHYSRYADDMTFSSMHNVYQEGSEFRSELVKIIEEQGFVMNDKKTRLLRDGNRQEVTGLTVNERVNVTRKYVRDLRCILHVWETKGYATAYSYFYPHYKREKGYIKKGEPVMENVIDGKLNYLRMVRGEGNPAYQKLLLRYQKLQQIVYIDKETDRGNNYIYVQPYKIDEFEALFHTEIKIQVSIKDEIREIFGTCQINGLEKKIRISKSTQNEFAKGCDELSDGDTLYPQQLGKSFVTLCRHKGKNFWLLMLHEPRRSEILSIQNAQFDIDKLLEVWKKDGINVASKMLKDFVLGYRVTITSKGNKKEVIVWEKMTKSEQDGVFAIIQTDDINKVRDYYEKVLQVTFYETEEQRINAEQKKASREQSNTTNGNSSIEGLEDLMKLLN